MSTKFELSHIEVIIDLVGRDGKRVHIVWRSGKEEWVTKKVWEIIKENHNWTTDF